tara:strand:- start:166 stop:552 length:387 start_codon:yes stop_codon:yes gene_type:complete
MGYRSDVTIMMYPRNDKDFAMLKLFVDETFPDKFEVHEDNNRTKGFKYLLLEIDSIKWYDSYEEVQKYTKAFNEWDDMFADDGDPKHTDPLVHYEFMRVGEEYEDVEYHSSYGADHNLNLSREVYIDL